MKLRSFTSRPARKAAVLSVGALLAACTPGGGAATETVVTDTETDVVVETQTGEVAPAATGEATAGEPMNCTVTVWHYFTDAQPQQTELMDEFANLAEAANPGLTVENVFVPYDQMNSQLIAAAGAGTGPDVVVFNGAETSTIALAGALAPLNQYWDNYEDAAQFPESVLHSVDGQIYSVQGYVNLLGLWYNADILQEVGVQPPTTMEELEAAMAAATAAGHTGITLSGLPNTQGEFQSYPFLSESGFTFDNPDEAALTAGLTRVGNWVDEGWLPQEAVNWDQTVPFQNFLAGGVAFSVNGNWQIAPAASDATFNYGVTKLPLSQGGVYLGGEGVGIGAHSANPDCAWAYLKSSYLSVPGQLTAANLVGSIPSRTDAGQEDVIANNEMLAPFAETVATRGANYPSAAIPAEAVADTQLRMGQAWSSVIGRQHTPADAAATAITALNSLGVGQ